MESENVAIGIIAGGVVLVLGMILGASQANRQLTERYKACLERSSLAECAAVLR